ncbi:MAG TPA: hypothetical protein VIG36_13415 [Methylocystis sp.]
MADLASIHKQLSFIDVKIISVHEGVADTVDIGRVVSFASSSAKMGSRKSGLAWRASCAGGRSAGGCAYRYRPTPGKFGELEIVAEAAEIVRRIFFECGEKIAARHCSRLEPRRECAEFEDFALDDARFSAEGRALFAALLSKVVLESATKSPVRSDEELPLKIEIRLTPLIALNKQALFTDDEKQSMMEHYLGGEMVAEVRCCVSPQNRKRSRNRPLAAPRQARVATVKRARLVAAR